MFPVALFIAFYAFVGPNLSQQCDCGLENIQSRVFYGDEITYRKYPWLTYLEMDKDGETFTCGGSLIDSRRILTAAHCVLNDNYQKIPPKNIRPYLGIQSVNEVDEIIKPVEVSHYEVHPRFSNYNGYDIALIVLKEPVKFNKTISPICVPAFETDSNLVNKKLTVVGWGINDEQPDEDDPETIVPVSPEVPMEAEVDFLSHDRCLEMHHNRGGSLSESVDSYREICAVNFVTGAEACAGDSGGPLMYKNSDDNRWYLAGIVSRAPKCPSFASIPGVYSKLKSLRAAIETLDVPEDFCHNF